MSSHATVTTVETRQQRNWLDIGFFQRPGLILPSSGICVVDAHDELLRGTFRNRILSSHWGLHGLGLLFSPSSSLEGCIGSLCHSSRLVGLGSGSGGGDGGHGLQHPG